MELLTFTSQEIQVIQFICQQYFDNEIAKKLDISKQAVKSIKDQVKSKMGVKRTPGVVIYAIKHDIYKI